MGSCIIHILYTGVLNFKRKFRRQRVNDVNNNGERNEYTTKVCRAWGSVVVNALRY
jgi:hypothetical protein